MYLSNAPTFQIFENKGSIVGCSNSHPHCQVWGSTFLPYLVKLEEVHQREYEGKHGAPLLLNYLTKVCETNIDLTTMLQQCYN